MSERFLADEMLGKLARELRALGYDAAYVKHVEDDEVLERARAEDRLLLTRDVQLADRAGEQGFLVQAREPGAQLEDLIEALGLQPAASDFLSRCLECNTLLSPTDASEQVPDGVTDRQHWRCPTCGGVYWMGTHAWDMLERLGQHLPEGSPSIDELDVGASGEGEEADG